MKILTKKGTFLTFLYFLPLFYAKKYDFFCPKRKKNPQTGYRWGKISFLGYKIKLLASQNLVGFWHLAIFAHFAPAGLALSNFVFKHRIILSAAPAKRATFENIAYIHQQKKCADKP